MGRLNGKVALLVGAAGKDNMAQIIARRFADEGAVVAVAGRHMDSLQALALDISGSAHYCDITDKSSIEQCVAEVLECHGQLNIGLNATGWGLLVPFEETTEQDLQAMLDLQFKGPFQWMQVLVANMASPASIIQISSATATILVGDHHAYIGTKAGIDHVVRGVADEYGAKGIRANSISPGLTPSPMAADHLAIPGLEQAFLKEYPLGRLNSSDDIAAAAVFLASDECFMTGQNLQVNGGLTLRRNPLPAEIADYTERAAQ
jgi:NAD(P)-dependent dehydrogenase (short-subunit alcohol dehydrogenase family)